MGCWNETCAISGLPILAGDECVEIYLSENPFYNVGSSHDDYFFVKYLPIYGIYDDYGSIRPNDEDQKLVLFIVDDIANKPTNIPIKTLSKKDLDSFIDEGLYLKSSPKDHKKKLKLERILIHKSIWDKILSMNYVNYNETVIDLNYFISENIGDTPYSSFSVYENYKKSYKKICSLHPQEKEFFIRRKSEMEMVELILTLTRFCWHPTSGKGSQGDEKHLFIDLHTKFLEVALLKIKEGIWDYDSGQEKFQLLSSLQKIDELKIFGDSIRKEISEYLRNEYE